MAETIEFKIHAKVDAVEKDLQSVRESVNNTEKSVNDLSQSFEKGGKSVKGIGKAMSGLGNVLKTGLGVGVVMKLFDALTEAFQNNREVADLLAKAGVVLTGMINGLIEVAKPAIQYLSKMFTDPQQAWQDFKDTLQAGADWLKDQFVDRVVDSFSEFGLGFESIINSVRQKWNELTGDDGELAQLNKRQKEIEKEQEDINKRQEERNDRFIATVNKVKDGIKSAYDTIAKSTKAAFDNADALANAEYELGRLQALYTGVVEEADLAAEKQRQIRDDEAKTIDERIEANQKLAEELEKGRLAERANIEAQKEQVNLLLTLHKDNRDLQLERLALEQELSGIEAKYAGLRSEQLTNINGLEKERIDLARSLAEGTIEANKILSESNAELAADGKEQFEARKQNLLDEFMARRKLLDDQIAMQKEGTQAYVDSVNERKILDAQYAADTRALAKETADYEVEQAKKTAEAKMATLEAVSSSLGSIAQLVGENSAFGKAVAVSQAIIDTYAGASKALAQGGIIGPVAAAGVIAAGLANVRAIMQTDVPEPPGGGGGGYAADIPALMPSVGIVGQQVNPNAQIAGSLNRNLGQPQRAYVIGQDVTTQTSLDRAIRKNATLGG